MFRFSGREIFLIGLIVAMGIGWGIHYQATDGSRRAAIQHAQSLHDALAVAKTRCIQLENGIKYVIDQHDKKPKEVLLYKFQFDHVDWSVLDKPIPGAMKGKANPGPVPKP